MIGILPAAGKAERLYGLPKYLLPIPGGYLIKRHIDLMKSAGCKVVGVSTNEDNYSFLNRDDIHPTVVERYSTMSETLLETYYERIVDLLYDQDNVLFAMPDTYIADEKLYQDMITIIENTTFEVIAAVFHAKEKNRSKLGMCDIDENLLIKNIVDKPAHTDLTYSWAMLAWKPSFWQYIKPEDSHVGFAVQRAIEDGVNVRAVYATGRCYDCGTIEGYYDLLKDIME